MINRPKPIELSRRLVSNYLLFGLLSVVAVAIGMSVLFTTGSETAAENSLMARLVQASTDITVKLDQGETAQLQPLVKALAERNGLLYGAVIDNAGIIQAHTSPAFVGQKSATNFSAAHSPGIMERVSYLHEDGTGPKEYWVPLRNSQRSLGMLQVAVTSEANSHPIIALLKQNAGLALAFPVLLLIAGGTRLRGVIGSSSLINQQLAELSDQEQATLEDLQKVEEDSPESIGWNRLISKASRAESFTSLESRLTEVLGGFREERYAQILQGLTDGIAVASEDGRITFANEAFARLLNKPMSDVMGQAIHKLLPIGHAENQINFDKQMHEPSRNGVVELWRSDEMADGLLRLGRSPMYSKEGELHAQLWTLRDVTQQKLIEHTRDQFVDTATHELRTPLSTIRACAEALELYDDIDLETQKHYVNTINNEATRLGRFVDEFLNISRMEAGSLALNRHNTHLEKLLMEVVDKARPAMQLKKLEFSAALPPKLPELKIDKDKIAAALMNLLGNAEKYTMEGGEVRLLTELADDEVRIHIEDSGIGIAPDELSRVFGKFFRSDDTRVREITGTGLGLSFSQEVIRLHGGSLTATSELNHGSRFTMTLPLHGTS